jgi:hypothetical protein
MELGKAGGHKKQGLGFGFWVLGWKIDGDSQNNAKNSIPSPFSLFALASRLERLSLQEP